jgi:hypothetical protein
MAYVKWLIYSDTAPFKSRQDGALGIVHAKYYADWEVSFSAQGKEKAYCEMPVLEKS